MGEKLNIAFLGDVALSGKFDISKLPHDYFDSVSEFLSDFDVVVANLEAPFVFDLGAKSNKSARISSKTENIALLKKLNVNVVCLSNNHIFDYGINGLKETVAILEENNILWFGVNNKSVHFFSERVSLHGFCSYNTNPIGINFDKKYFLNPTHFSDVMNCVNSDVAASNLSIICNHSGIENIPYPSDDDIKFARYISTVTDYIYIGHHPHVIQGSEVFNNSYLTYSLGNFCFDDIYDDKTNQILVEQSEDNRHGLIKTFDIENGRVVGTNEVICYQGEDSLAVGVDYCKYKNLADRALKNVDLNYNGRRDEKIYAIYRSRKATRNFTWFLSRLNFSTLSRLFHRRLNLYLYKKHYSSKIPR